MKILKDILIIVACAVIIIRFGIYPFYANHKARTTLQALTEQREQREKYMQCLEERSHLPNAVGLCIALYPINE